MLNKEELKEMQFFAQKVSEVHWPEHTEYIEVNNLVKDLENDIDINDETFEELKKLTNNYIIPKGACNAQTKLLTLLQKLDSDIL